MTRLALGTLAAALAVGLGTAAPVPKDASKPDPTPDLRVAFDTAARAVKAQKWPGADDERLLKNTARVVFERALKAADQKPRALPVDYAGLTKLDVVGEYAGNPLNNHFLIAGSVGRVSAKNSVIFASGPVQLGIVENCVVVAPSIRASTTYNCVFIAGDHLRLISSRRRPNGGDGSVLVSGKWIRATTLDGAVCHVIAPGTDPAPDDPKGAGAKSFAIQATRGDASIFLNEPAAAKFTLTKEPTHLPPKFPLAK